MNRTSHLNIAKIVIPFLCFLIAGGVISYEIRRIRRLEGERIQVEQNIATVEKLRQELDQHTPVMLNRFPTAQQSPQEQADFLNKLRAYAAATQIRIVRWTNATPIAPASGGESGPPKQSSIPPGVLPISSSIEVSGLYNDIRAFLYSLLRDPRLFSLTDIEWQRSDRWPRTRVSMTLTRYVTRERSPLNDVTAGAGASPSSLTSGGGMP